MNRYIPHLPSHWLPCLSLFYSQLFITICGWLPDHLRYNPHIIAIFFASYDTIIQCHDLSKLPKKLRWPWWPDQLWWKRRCPLVTIRLRPWTWLPSGKRLQKTMERSTMLCSWENALFRLGHLKNSYFDITRGYSSIRAWYKLFHVGDFEHHFISSICWRCYPHDICITTISLLTILRSTTRAVLNKLCRVAVEPEQIPWSEWWWFGGLVSSDELNK